jgi:hypothetical protein
MKSNSGYHWTAYANPSAEFYCINDIRDVIAGKKPENPSKLWLKASDVAFGLGNGSMNTIQGLGEAVLINGVSYTKSTDQAAENYYQLAHGDRFMTTWAFLMSKEAQPNFKLKNTQLKKSLTILDIYHLIYQKLKNPFFITAVLQCEMLKSSAIAKAPIEGQNIFTHANIYYPKTNILKNQSVGLVGIVANIEKLTPNFAKKMHRVVYDNSLENKLDSLTTHEHGVLLNQAVADINDIQIGEVKDIQHLFTDTLVSGFNLNIYIITEANIQVRTL